MFWRRKKAKPTPIELTPEQEISLLLHHIEFDALREQNKALLEALEELVELAAPNIYPQPDKPNAPWAKLQRARAAIAKVKGHGT